MEHTILVVDGMVMERLSKGARQQEAMPYTWGEDMNPWAGRPRAPMLPVVDDMAGPVTILSIEQRHDGAAMYTQFAISAVVGCAEKTALERGGDWEMSKVRVFSDYPHGDMAYGKNVMHCREIISVAIRKSGARRPRAEAERRTPMIDLNSLNPGDEITIRVRVNHVRAESVVVETIDFAPEEFAVLPETIVSHSKATA